MLPISDLNLTIDSVHNLNPRLSLSLASREAKAREHGIEVAFFGSRTVRTVAQKRLKNYVLSGQKKFKKTGKN